MLLEENTMLTATIQSEMHQIASSLSPLDSIKKEHNRSELQQNMICQEGE